MFRGPKSAGLRAEEWFVQVAKYKAIVKEIEDQIRRGVLKPYDSLPTVVELTKRYHVSRSTIGEVMDELEKRGLVSRKRGSGVYVKKVPVKSVERPLNTVTPSANAGLDLSGDMPTCKVHEFTIVKPDEEIMRELGLHEHSFTYYVVRSHQHEGKLLDIQYIYYPVEIFRDIRLTSAETSIHSWIEESYEVTPDSYHKTLRAIMPEQSECELLGIDPGMPMLEVVQVGFLDDGRPFEYLISRYPGSYAEYQTIDSDSLPV